MSGKPFFNRNRPDTAQYAACYNNNHTKGFLPSNGIS